MFNWTKRCETTTHHDVNAKYVSDKGVDIERMVIILNHGPKNKNKDINFKSIHGHGKEIECM